MNRALWERSGHWDKYQDKMFISEADDDIYAIKPMNCPGCVLVYNSQPHSYRDLHYVFLNLVWIIGSSNQENCTV